MAASPPSPLPDWNHWTPRERAVLCFIQKDERILLIHKRRGLGAGKVNAPGGKIEADETPLQAAVRETQEEIGVTPRLLTEAGVLHFQFTDGYSLYCTVFTARDFDGEPVETAEADPFWAHTGAIPYGAMWADDIHWLPHLLAGRAFKAWFTFDGEKMLSHQVELHSALPASAS